jgi:8-oxo-dGTP pyrophosphatase MutT (NUDIX family)
MDELWQRYDNQGRPITDHGVDKDIARAQGILHGAAHVWIWRRHGSTIEVLIQKRISSKATWPGMYDISAAGHIDFGEEPIVAALRETEEELGITIADSALTFVGVVRSHMITHTLHENELRWLYILELAEDTSFTLQASEVDSVVWRPLADFARECGANTYVPHGNLYYQTILGALSAASGPIK